MSRQEFIARQREAARAGSCVDVPGVVILVSGLLLLVPSVRYLCTCYPPARVICAALLGAVSFIAVNYLLAVWVRIRRAHAYALTCPGCGRSLLGAPDTYLMATGRCGCCDTLILFPAEPAVA